MEVVPLSPLDLWQTYVPSRSGISPTRTYTASVAGSGKSVLWFVTSRSCCTPSSIYRSSGIIEDILPQRKAGSAVVAYFYCDIHDQNKQTRHGLLCSILSQLCAQSNISCDSLADIYSEHGKGTKLPSDWTLTKCLEVLARTTQDHVYLIVDALDECPNNRAIPSQRKLVLDLVEGLVRLFLPNLHICVTSRPEIDIQATLEPLTSLRVSLHNQPGQIQDIADYVTAIVSSDTKMRRWREEDRKLIIESLSERADGM